MKAEGKKQKERARWYLEAVADTGREWMVAIDPVPFIIGRETACNLTLTDKRVSRRHSEIRKSGDHYWIRDLDSKNGTFVNQKQIEQSELIEAGDNISIGKFKFRVKILESDAAPIVEDTFAINDDFAYPVSLEAKLRDMIRDRNIIPHFQPVLNISDMTVIGYEILARAYDKDLPDEPVKLFDMAEWFGCGTELSTLFREVGMEKGKNLPGAPSLFMNVTSFEINQMSILLESLRRLHDIAPENKVVIEINEKSVNEINEMNRLRETLKQLDMSLAFDDFGVGQTRLIDLAKVPPEFLKFDISLIRNIHLAPIRLHQMVSTFVKATQDLGITTIAEGVECSEEADVCQKLGFNLAQGFYYGMPQPVDEINQKSTSD